MRREHLQSQQAREADRADRARSRRNQSALEFTLMITCTHWLFHGLTIPTFALSIALGLVLAWAIERWFIGRYPATGITMCGYGLVLSATPTLLPFGVFASFVFICCGTQMLRLTRESEWNGA